MGWSENKGPQVQWCVYVEISSCSLMFPAKIAMALEGANHTQHFQAQQYYIVQLADQSLDTFWIDDFIIF